MSVSRDLATQIDLAIAWGEHTPHWLKIAEQLVREAPRAAGQAALDECQRRDLVRLNAVAEQATREQANLVPAAWLHRRHDELQRLRRILDE